MKSPALERWLLRKITSSKGATRVELRHRGEDGERVVHTHELADGSGKEELATIAVELLQDANDEAEIAGVRMSFLIVVLNDDDRVLASTPIRASKAADLRGRTDDDDDDDNEPTRAGVLELMMSQNKVLFRELSGAPARQRAVYEDIVEFQNALILAQRAEISELHKRLEQSGDADEDYVVELALEREQRAAMFERLLSEGGQLLTSVVQAATGGGAQQNPTANGHDTGH